MKKGLAAALHIEGVESQVKALAVFFKQIPDSSSLLINLRKTIIDHLFRNLRLENRSSVLIFLSKDRIVSSPILDKNTLGTITEHIIEICFRWKWL